LGDPGENPESLEPVDPLSVTGLLGTLDDLLMLTGWPGSDPFLARGMVMAPANEPFGDSGRDVIKNFTTVIYR
jgi:hypothetical protein